MHPKARRLLFVEGYTSKTDAPGSISSDAIGYGITAARAIRHGLAVMGYEIIRSSTYIPRRSPNEAWARSHWILDSYNAILKSLCDDNPDLVFCFHAFQAFPAEIRRMMSDIDLQIPLIGYTHGSHWDYTDRFRYERYPGLEFADLGNLYTMDRILLASRYMQRTLHENISALSPRIAATLDAKVRVVGLPIDIRAMDANRTHRRFSRPTIVYNHAPINSKDPHLFLNAAELILRQRKVNILFTRKIPPGGTLRARAVDLASRYPGQLRFGNDLPISDYYRALWMSDIQVSTALHESLGISTLEAMYTRNCCILPRLGSYPEICDGDQDILYERSSGQLVDRLLLAIDDKERRKAIARRLQRFARRYAPDQVVPAISSAITELVPQEPGQR